MSPEAIADRKPRPKRNKTDLACDTCRRRKSRCDGRRPSCSHCEHMRMECIYRPPLTSLETDTSVLSRLSQIETRLHALDQGRIDPSLADVPVIKTWSQVPKFHHAAAHKMFNYWTNLRSKIEDIPGLEPLSYVCQVDENETDLFSANFEIPAPPEIPVSVVIRGIDCLFANVQNLPFVFRHLFLYAGLSKEVCLEVFRWYLEASPSNDIILEFKTQSIEELLVQAITLKHLAIVTGERMLFDQADLSFRHALQKMWLVQTLQNPHALPFRFLFVIMMLYLYGRPYHALSILQSLEPLVYNTAPKRQDDEAVKARYEACLYQFFILESDILSEIDGVPAERLHPVILAALTQKSAAAPPIIFGNEPMVVSPEDFQSQELQAHLQLRAYMNTILEHMYNTDRAYCRPVDVAMVVTDIARRLDLWYWTLPLNMRFPRYPSSFCVAPNDMSPVMDELRFRYYATIFLVNRPILYHVLHLRVENAVNAANAANAVIAANAANMEIPVPEPVQDPIQDPIQDPWVYESCHNCVQNAVMIILLHSRRHHTRRNKHFESWCNLQHLVAAYATILQVQTSAISILLQGYGDPDHLLDLAEVALEHGLNRPANLRKSLGILRHIRQSFRRSSPRTPSIGNGYASSPVHSVTSHHSQLNHQS